MGRIDKLEQVTELVEPKNSQSSMCKKETRIGVQQEGEISISPPKNMKFSSADIMV